jgi:serine/threonine-protein kinase RsbW
MFSVRQQPAQPEMARPNGPTGMYWERTIPELGELEAVLEEVTARMAAVQYTERDLFCVRLALEEAIANAVKHGHRGDPGKVVALRLQVTSEHMLAEIEDEGSGFDPEQVPDPRDPENLEKPTGRGLLLMRTYMTWVRYNSRGNCVTLCRRRTVA